MTTLYDTICQIWPQYREPGHSRFEIQQQFLLRYPVNSDYKGLSLLPMDGPDPLKLWESD